MNKFLLLLVTLTIAQLPVFANQPDSVYLLSYATAKNNNHNGLHFAWSPDRQHWQTIGNEHAFVKCDYGRWGSEKRMLTPYLMQDANGVWQCVWSINEREPAFAQVSSPDLVYWGRQVYPRVADAGNCLQPVISYNAASKNYTVAYQIAGKSYAVTTADFKTWSKQQEIAASAVINKTEAIQLAGGSVNGQVHYVPWAVAEKLIQSVALIQYKNGLNNESTRQDAERFAGLKPVEAKFTVNAAKAKPISDLLMGVFFEDINYAADGGLYGELVQNRDFEYDPADKEGRDKNWNSMHSWSVTGQGSSFTIDTVAPIHANNRHYALLETTNKGATFSNTGYDGIPVKKGEVYNFSLFGKLLDGKSGQLLVKLVNEQKETLAQGKLKVGKGSWKKLTATLTATADATNAHLEILPQAAGKLALDMVSLFPANTFKNRKNGLRADLAQAVADIRPRFIRFPGGCVAHGDGLGNIYRWKNSIGPLEARKPQRNLWGYHQTAGLGYFEYFQYCEDIGAQPLPVLAAGVPCQNSGNDPLVGGGQQGGLPLADMDEYIQDVLDLIEWANGSANTFWGKKRAEAGHPQPFNLKYVGIGNEDLISDVFEERFAMIFKAVQQKHPEITVIGTVGPFYEGTDYEEGWQLASKLQVPMVDEHYYVPPGWMINNQDYYDKYDRNKAKVYLGEYAAHLPGRPNNLETALAEALYLTSLERNGDVVTMSSYAPLLAKDGHTQWTPDLIYFNNHEVRPTVGYEVQKLYGVHAGNEYLPASSQLSNNQEAVKKRVTISVVRDSKSKDIIVKLVNLLPVETKASVDLKGLGIAPQQAMQIVLTGQPADKNARPVSATIAASELLQQTLPAYSFTVIRLKR